jgi:hypothetical protein
MLTYPGEFDTDWDGIDDQFDEAWLQEVLSTVIEFKTERDVPLAVNEYGVVRWIPGASSFMHDQMAIFEALGLNYALWIWEVSWEPYAQEVHAFNLRFGSDPEHLTDLDSNSLMDVISVYWSRNAIRPSSFNSIP